MKSKFTALRIIGVLFKLVAWIVLLGGIAGAVIMNQGSLIPTSGFAITSGAFTGALYGALITILIAVVSFLFLYAAGDLVRLLISIGANAQKIGALLEEMLPPTESGPDTAP